jgi:hypothetical protein
MKPDPRFLNLSPDFWAHVRTISEMVGYTSRGSRRIKTPSFREIYDSFTRIGLSVIHLEEKDGTPSNFANNLIQYFGHRASILNNYVEPRLMDADRAKKEFETLRQKLSPKIFLPMNKQKGEKKTHAFLTGITNMLIERYSNGYPCDFDPKRLTTFTKDRKPLRTLSRRVDGAFPSVVNPIAIWEIKEYYYTTTFGSRVADGIYETLLDGMELQELRERENILTKHYLIVDAYSTWWTLGRSYLCRIIDLLHMRYIDEVLFGYEVIERMPELVQEWVELLKNNTENTFDAKLDK